MGDRSEASELARTLAGLARLGLSESEARAFGADLAGLLEAFRTLQAADVEGIPPLFAPVEGTGQSPREDRPEPGLERRELLAVAPDADPGSGAGPGATGEGRFFRVPAAIPPPPVPDGRSAPNRDGGERP